MSDEKPPANYVLGAIKFFTEKEHAEAFVKGQILMNSVVYFQTIESSDMDGRADSDEGLSALVQPTPTLVFKIGDHNINPSDIVGPIRISMKRDQSKNILCLHAIFSDGYFNFKSDEMHLVDPTENGLKVVNEHFKMSERCFEMGKIAVVIYNIKEFKKRMIDYTLRKEFHLTVGRVQYYDRNTHNGKFEEPGLHKRSEFSWQREYRFILDRGIEKAEPYTMNLGSLTDICGIVDSSQIKSGFVVNAERLHP